MVETIWVSQFACQQFTEAGILVELLHRAFDPKRTSSVALKSVLV